MSTWSAPVRYAEVDGQGVVFNSHYLLYCDEAMSAWRRERDMLRLAERVQLVASTIAWKSGAKWGEQLTVDVACSRIGTTSFVLDFEIRQLARMLPGATWTAAGIGRHQLTVNEWALELGGHCRTGLEDNIRFDHERLAASNAELVRRVASIAAQYDRRPATPAEARTLLGLRAAD